MDLNFCSLSSGSKGNSYVVWNREVAVLIDTGISGKKIFEGIDSLGINRDRVKGILITHEHTDHIKSLRVVNKKLDKANIYTNYLTWDRVKEKNEKLKEAENSLIYFEREESFFIDSLFVTPIKIHHDAIAPVGYKISYGEKSVAIITDTGHICDNIHYHIRESDVLVMESNHEENILMTCDYPYNTKMRILSDHGHLSNTYAGNSIGDILDYRKSNDIKGKMTILLGHISMENNTPQMARMTVENILRSRGLLDMQSVHLDVITQSEKSAVYKI